MYLLGKELEESILDLSQNPSVRLLRDLSLNHIYCRLVLSLFKNIILSSHSITLSALQCDVITKRLSLPDHVTLKWKPQYLGRGTGMFQRE